MKRQAPHEMQQPQLQPPQPPQALQALQPQPPQPLQPLQPLQPRAYCTPGLSISLSKTKNVPKLTSEISSSVKVNWGTGAVSRNGTSGAGPTAPAADAPP